MGKYEVGYRQMRIKVSIKFSETNLSFLRRVGINEAFANGKEKALIPSRALDLIEKYFKLNNDEYKEMIKMGAEK